MCLSQNKIADTDLALLVCDREGATVDLDAVKLEYMLGDLETQ